MLKRFGSKFRTLRHRHTDCHRACSSGPWLCQCHIGAGDPRRLQSQYAHLYDYIRVYVCLYYLYCHCWKLWLWFDIMWHQCSIGSCGPAELLWLEWHKSLYIAKTNPFFLGLGFCACWPVDSGGVFRPSFSDGAFEKPAEVAAPPLTVSPGTEI